MNQLASERWDALGHNMSTLIARVEALSISIKTLTYLTIGLTIVTALLLATTLVILTTSGR